MMSPTNPVYTVALTDKVWVRTYIPETDLGRIKWGIDGQGVLRHRSRPSL